MNGTPLLPKQMHPFIDGLQEVPEDRTVELLKVRQWICTQPHLPPISDDYIYLFLHANYYCMDKTRQAIENYFSVRANNPAIFADRDPYLPRMQTVIGLGHLIRLPKNSPEGYKVLLYSVRDPDPSKVIFADAVKGFCMYNDCVLSEDGLAKGYLVIFDMKGISLGHLTRVNLPALRAFMFYIQEAHPCRLKGVHIVNTASWIHLIMRLVLPLVKSEMLSIVQFHKGMVPDGLPLDIMPIDYGGEAPCIEELDQQTKNMVAKYASWLKESEYYRADDSRRLNQNNGRWWRAFTLSGGGSPLSRARHTNTAPPTATTSVSITPINATTSLRDLHID